MKYTRANAALVLLSLLLVLLFLLEHIQQSMLLYRICMRINNKDTHNMQTHTHTELIHIIAVGVSC